MSAKNVAIVGFTPHREQTPFENPEWEIWPLNDLYMDIPVLPYERFRWFQIHEWQEGRPVDSPTDFSMGPHHPRDPNHVPWLREVSEKMTVYIRPETKPHVPKGVVFPYDEIHDAFKRKYFTNTITYMIALALHEGFEKIGVYGVDMMVSGGQGSEYGYQRPSCEWMLGIAEERLGYENVILPRETDLLKTAFLYGTEHGNDWRMGLEGELTHYNNQLSQLEIQRKNLDNTIHEFIGTRNSHERILRCHAPGDDGDWGANAPREKGTLVYPKLEMKRLLALPKAE